MRRLPLTLTAVLAAGALVAGCGSGGGEKEGGKLTIFDTKAGGGVSSLDPGNWYYQPAYKELGNTTQRWLYGWKPDESKPTPDLATALPQVSNGGRRLTIKIRPGIKYSAPLQNRSVKTADVKYAIERCFRYEATQNGYAKSYYGAIEGSEEYAAGDAEEVVGIQAPDDTTLVIDTTEPVGVLTNGFALGMPCTAPVPKDYAAKFDEESPSTYGEHAVFTGPYMVENDGKGNVTGFKPGERLTLVRNPSWDEKTDFKPAYFDRIEVKGGYESDDAPEQTLRGKGMLSGDYAAPPTNVLKQALTQFEDQVDVQSSSGNRYISLNTKVKPLDNVNVRRAISAAIDREALRQTRGGPAVGTLATHWFPKEIAGFQEAGGEKGPGLDFTASPKANIPLARQYLRKAGYESGSYEGPELLVFADAETPTRETALAFASQLEKVGFKLKMRFAPHLTVVQKHCGTPKAEVAICPTLGWGPDFFSSQSMIEPLFHGKNISESANLNTAQVNDPALNAKIDRAKAITNPAAAARAWGELDREVTSQAYLIPWLWDNNVGLRSEDVNGVTSKFNGGDWDLAFSSLEE